MIIKQTTRNEENLELSKEDMMRLIDNNRSRARAFCNVIISVSSLFFSTSFVILFFIQEKSEALSKLSLISSLLVTTNLIMIAAIFAATMIVFSRRPIAIATKTESILYQAGLYRKELRYANYAFGLLLVGMIIFLTALVIFSVQSIP